MADRNRSSPRIRGGPGRMPRLSQGGGSPHISISSDNSGNDLSKVEGNQQAPSQVSAIVARSSVQTFLGECLREESDEEEVMFDLQPAGPRGTEILLRSSVSRTNALEKRHSMDFGKRKKGFAAHRRSGQLSSTSGSTLARAVMEKVEAARAASCCDKSRGETASLRQSNEGLVADLSFSEQLNASSDIDLDYESPAELRRNFRDSPDVSRPTYACASHLYFLLCKPTASFVRFCAFCFGNITSIGPTLRCLDV